MRIKVFLQLQRIPIIYRHRLLALIKEALKLSDCDYKNELYPGKHSYLSKKTKPFSFSLFIPPEYSSKTEPFFIDGHISIKDTVIYPSSGIDVALFISSSDYQFIINLYNGLLKIKDFLFMEFPAPDGARTKEYLRTGRVFMLKERTIDNDEVLFKTLSYISIEDEKDKPIDIFTKDGKTINTVELERFNYHLNAIQERRLKDIRGYGLKRPLEFLPIKMKRKGVKHTISGFRKQTGKPYMVLTTYQGTFCLRGAPEDLQLLYQTGIGLRTGQGFGMIDIA